MERMDQFIERIDREIRLTREMHGEFIRDSREWRRSNRIMINRLFRLVEENSEAMREMREASQAHTQAIYALLDRFNNGGPAPATG
jgi:hypothetical protein